MLSPDITGKKILILATHGFEQSELEVPRDRLRAAGATVDIVSPESHQIRGWENGDWGRLVKVDRVLLDVSADDYDAIVLPGGQMNPDTLRVNKDALSLIRAFWQQRKVVAAICHAPWLLIQAGLVVGLQVTSYKSVATDLTNAGAFWRDAPVVADRGIVTSRNPGDLEAFSAKVIDEILMAKHRQREAA